jgi:hypothetical protein
MPSSGHAPPSATPGVSRHSGEQHIRSDAACYVRHSLGESHHVITMTIVPSQPKGSCSHQESSRLGLDRAGAIGAVGIDCSLRFR